MLRPLETLHFDTTSAVMEPRKSSAGSEQPSPVLERSYHLLTGILVRKALGLAVEGQWVGMILRRAKSEDDSRNTSSSPEGTRGHWEGKRIFM